MDDPRVHVMAGPKVSDSCDLRHPGRTESFGMTIRPATIADCTSIATIWNQVIRDTAITFNPTEKSADDVAAMIAEKEAGGYAVFVATKMMVMCGGSQPTASSAAARAIVLRPNIRLFSRRKRAARALDAT